MFCLNIIFAMKTFTLYSNESTGILEVNGLVACIAGTSTTPCLKNDTDIIIKNNK